MHPLRRNGFAGRTFLLLGVLFGFLSSGLSGFGQTPGEASAENAWLPLDQAMPACKQTGKLLIVVTSSRAEPNSTRFVATLKEVVSFASSELAPLFTEMPVERFEADLKRLGVTTHPTLILYRHGPRGIELVGSRSGLQTVRQAVAWLDSIGALRIRKPAAAEPAQAQGETPLPPLPERSTPAVETAQRDHDPQLQRTGGQPPHFNGQMPSGQVPYTSEQGGAPPPMPPAKIPPPTPPSYSPPAYSPPPSYQPVQQVAPVTGMVSTPVMVSPPQVPVVVQPQAPTIVVGPTPQPNIIFAASAPSAPTISYMVQGNAPVANAPTGNAPQQIFMANAPQPAASAPQPMAMAPQPMAMAPQPMAMAPQPMAMAPQPMAMAPQPMAMAPQPMAMAPVGQAPTGQSPALLAAVLTNPSIFGRILGAIGEHLAQKKNPRIQMGQAPQMMQVPVAQAPVGAAPQGALAYAAMGYGAAPAAPQGFMGYMAGPGGGPPSGYGYGYGYGPPPGQGYGPGPGYPPYSPQGPPEGYPQGPPPVAPSPQGNGHWWGGHSQNNYGGSQPQQPPNPPAKQGWLSSLWK